MYTFLYKYCWQYLYTSIAIIHFKRSHIENKFRQLDKFTFNLSIFFNEMFSIQNPFSNWIVNIRLSIIYLLYVFVCKASCLLWGVTILNQFHLRYKFGKTCLYYIISCFLFCILFLFFVVSPFIIFQRIYL